MRTVVEDARKAIPKNGMPWFHRFSDLKEVLRKLLKDSKSHEGTHGFGTKQSPDHHFKTGFMALSLGKTQLAQEHLQNALDSGCFKKFEPKIRGALEQTK